MRRKKDGLREELLRYARQQVAQEGPENINIRDLAQRAGIASGTVYNYFSGKDELLLALIEESWSGLLVEMDVRICAGSFLEQAAEIFDFLRQHVDGATGRMMRTLSQTPGAGAAQMTAMQALLADNLRRRMAKDTAITLASRDIAPDTCVRLLMRTMLALLRVSEPQQEWHLFLELLRPALYAQSVFQEDVTP